MADSPTFAIRREISPTLISTFPLVSSKRYGALASASDDDPTTSEVFTYAIRVQFVGDQDGQALVRLPDQSQTIVEYTALTVADDRDGYGGSGVSPEVAGQRSDIGHDGEKMSVAKR